MGNRRNVTSTDLSTSRDGFRRYIDLLGQLHRLMANGREDSAEADAVRDLMDKPWRYLDETMIARARGLSADLYTLDGGPRRTRPPPPTDASRSVARQLVAAKEKGDHDEVLRLLREGAPYLAPGVVAYLRGSIWLNFGIPSIAVLFFGHAWRVAPENKNYGWLWLNTLVEADESDEAAPSAGGSPALGC